MYKRDLKFNTTSRVIESCYHQLGVNLQLRTEEDGVGQKKFRGESKQRANKLGSANGNGALGESM